ncbi:MAG: putative ABC transport system permease protein [Paraglaciecola sp.]|jgi:putative ABC transport system permease protein
MLIKLTLASLLSRKTMALLTVISIGVSLFVLLGVDHLKSELRANFSRTVSGVDLIVGARTSQLNLLLYSVFRMGEPSNNLSWQSFQRFADDKGVSWAVPISLGDSHQGYAVIGTTADYFSYFKYADKQPLMLKQGRVFTHLFEVVLGAEVAKRLNYTLGDEVNLSHGTGKHSFSHHDQHPFVVRGILQFTGTPIDQSLHIPIAAVQVIHENQARENLPLDEPRLLPDKQDTLSAFLLGVENKITLLSFQRTINQHQDEALSAILPGVALMELWKIMGAVETSLSLVSVLILFSALLGMTTMLLASMREREREISVLRALGARAGVIIWLVVSEAFLLTLAACVLGYVSLSLALMFSQSLLQQEYGLYISSLPLSSNMAGYFVIALSMAMLLAFIPAFLAYRRSLVSGLALKR